MTSPIHFVCVATGDFHGLADIYLVRLHRMLTRHAGRPFQLWCVTDTPRKVPVDIRQIDCTSWTELHQEGMRPTTVKLGLFNPAYTALAQFIYLDLTLVIRQDMSPLINHMLDSPHDLVILKDWGYESYNSSVMRIRPEELAFIYRSFAQGKRYPQKTKGDQDFIFAAIKDHQRESLVDLVPAPLVVSFKHTMRLGFRAPSQAASMVENAVIVKFHGSPRMHRALHPVYRTLKYNLRFWLKGRMTPFSLAALSRAWKEPQ
ncbi:MAG: hypothetical protein EOP38_06290 [Rubrivivax sp.]|nr:MAG: hypothetical protein EOP38_06290 [Rubrivivax sp.]